MINYQQHIFSRFRNKGRLWESDFIHYYFGGKTLSKLKSGRVLDVGCGAGALTSLWSKKIPKLDFYGVDISKEAIKIAKLSDPNILYKVSSAYPLPFDKSYFSGVLSCEVLEHVKNPSLMLKEISRVLKKGGIVYLTTPLEGDNRTLIGRFYAKRGIYLKKKSAGHIQMFSEAKLRSLFAEAGLTIERVYYDRIILAQLADFLYAHYLKNSGTHPLKLSKDLDSKSAIIKLLGSFGMRTLALLFNIETLILRNFPGSAIQIVATKK